MDWRFVSIFSFALVGCATVTTTGNTFQGANDFRIVSVPHDWTDKLPPDQKYDIPLGTQTRFQFHPTQAEMSGHAEEYFKAKDFIQLTMKTAYVNDFTEGVEQVALNKIVGALLSTPSPVKGEIAIVANVTEGKTTPGSRDAEGNLMGRVVFYSDDVYKRQLLNEFNIPLYGPLPYEGGELTVDLWVLELDRAESEQFGAVLRSLADASGQSAGLSIPGLNILSKVGAAFLNSNQDDIIGHIKFTLVPPQPETRETDPILRTSDILITRTPDRTFGSHWNDCVYRPLNGLVFCPKKGKLVATLDNLVVISVRKASSTVDIGPDLNWKDFSDRVKTAPSVPALDLVIDEFADTSARAANLRAAISAADSVLNPLTSQLVRERDADFLLKRIQCAVMVDQNATSALVDKVCGAHAANRQLGLAELDNIVRRLELGTTLKCAALTQASVFPAGSNEAELSAAREKLIMDMKPGAPQRCSKEADPPS